MGGERVAVGEAGGLVILRGVIRRTTINCHQLYVIEKKRSCAIQGRSKSPHH
jgi:hypothetical protein